MSEIKTFNCPTCGAALSTTGEEAEIKCPYCSNTVIVPPELRKDRVADAVTYDEPATTLSDVASPNLKPIMTFVGGIVGVSVVAPLVITLVTLVFVAVIMVVVFGVIVPTVSNSSRSFGAFPTAVNIALTAQAIATRAAARPETTATPKPAASPTATPLPLSKVLFQDNFNDPNSGWDHGTFDQNEAGYVPGGYHLRIGKDMSGEPVWVKDGFGDMSIEVDAKQTAGPLDSWMGVLCRVRKGVGGYAFEVTSTGRYQIVKYYYSAQASRASTLERGDLSVPPRSDAPNQLRADCLGSNLVLWVNGRVVGNFKDSEFTAGGVGLIVETGASGKAGGDILFSNYLVKGP